MSMCVRTAAAAPAVTPATICTIRDNIVCARAKEEIKKWKKGKKHTHTHQELDYRCRSCQARAREKKMTKNNSCRFDLSRTYNAHETICTSCNAACVCVSVVVVIVVIIIVVFVPHSSDRLSPFRFVSCVTWFCVVSISICLRPHSLLQSHDFNMNNCYRSAHTQTLSTVQALIVVETVKRMEEWDMRMRNAPVCVVPVWMRCMCNRVNERV